MVYELHPHGCFIHIRKHHNSIVQGVWCLTVLYVYDCRDLKSAKSLSLYVKYEGRVKMYRPGEKMSGPGWNKFLTFLICRHTKRNHCDHMGAECLAACHLGPDHLMVVQYSLAVRKITRCACTIRLKWVPVFTLDRSRLPV